jgi:hypothetical protein
MKRIMSLFFIFLLAIVLVGCKSNNKKEFSQIGVTITLNDTFVEKEVIQAPFYLESKNHFFMANREAKTELLPYGITSIDAYIQAVLTNAGKSVSVKSVNEDDVSYKYAYYTSTVGDQSFGYMLVVMEGENHFYTMNFGCLETNFDDSKDLYTKWTKTITVE